MVFLSFLEFLGTHATPSRLGGCRVSPSGGTLHSTTERPHRPGITQPIQKHTHEPNAPEKPTERPTARTTHTNTQTNPGTMERTRANNQDYILHEPGRSTRTEGSPNGDPHRERVERKKNPGNNAGAVNHLFIFNNSPKSTNGKAKIHNTNNSFHPLIQP